MPQISRKKSKKKSGRVSGVPLPSGSSGISAVDSRQDSTEFENAGAGPSRSDELPTPSVPDNSTLKSHGSQPPTRQPRSESNVVESSPFATLPTPNQNPLRQPPHQPVPAPQPGDTQGVSRSPGSTTSFFTGASGCQMGDIHYYEASYLPANRGSSVGNNSIDGWELLLKNTASNALYNSRARYDAPKCDEDTRVEVIEEIMDQIQDRDGPQHLLCMTGAAGSGKSALQQTTAEKCGKSGILAASIFLSAGDPTRNTVDLVIPTIAYQLGRKNATVKRLVKATIENDPLIFTQSLEDQATALIVEPFEHMRNTGADLWSLPYVILIDGLDECKGENHQAELLTAIRRCLLADDLHFSIFIASRPEWAIRTALGPGGYLRRMAYHIQLSDKYDASADMHRYLQRRFKDIGVRINDPEWFSEGDIETLVTAGSGQFVYVATVYKYISERRASPAERLKIVLTWTPHEGQVTRPFEALDRLYTNILLAAKNAYEAVDSHHGRDFLFLFRVYQLNANGRGRGVFDFARVDFEAEILSALLRLEARAEEILLSDVRSLVTLEKHGIDRSYLRLYHKSLSDFLEQPGRAKELFVPDSRVDTHLAKCLMQYIIDSRPTKWEELPLPALHIRNAVRHLARFLARAHDIDEEVVDFTENGGWQKIEGVLPLMFNCHLRLKSWIQCLRHFTSALKDRKPEVAAVIRVFLEKWDNEHRQYHADRRQS